MKIELQTRMLRSGRVLRVEVHRDDAGNMILARLELLPQHTRRPRLGLVVPSSNTTAENRQLKFDHPKCFGLPFGGGGTKPKANISARLQLLPQHTRRPRLGPVALSSNTTAENRQLKFDHPKCFGFPLEGGGTTGKENKCNAT